MLCALACLLVFIGSTHGFSFAPTSRCRHIRMEDFVTETLSPARAATSRIASTPRLSATAAPPAAETSVATLPSASQPISALRYDHLQFFVDSLKPLSHYKAIEERLNELAERVPTEAGAPVDVAAARDAWRELGPSADPDAFQVHGRDLVEQLLYGFGWRITAQHEGRETRSVLVSTVDPAGARFVITCKHGADAAPGTEATGAVTEAEAVTEAAEAFDHFGASHVDRYLASHANAQGVAVLGFEVRRALDRLISSHHISSHHIASHRITSYHITSHHIASQLISSQLISSPLPRGRYSAASSSWCTSATPPSTPSCSPRHHARIATAHACSKCTLTTKARHACPQLTSAPSSALSSGQTDLGARWRALLARRGAERATAQWRVAQRAERRVPCHCRFQGWWLWLPPSRRECCPHMPTTG
jgi:hypothetical protein